MAWNKARDRQLSRRAQMGRVVHDSSRLGTAVGVQGFAHKPLTPLEQAAAPRTEVTIKLAPGPKAPEGSEPA